MYACVRVTDTIEYVNTQMNVRGRTTRLILNALHALSEGYHVVVIAHPANEAFRIVESVAHYADELGIPCAISERNELDFMSDVPLLYTRPFGWMPMTLRRHDPAPKILVDHSAVFERTHTSVEASLREINRRFLADYSVPCVQCVSDGLPTCQHPNEGEYANAPA